MKLHRECCQAIGNNKQTDLNDLWLDSNVRVEIDVYNAHEARVRLSLDESMQVM